MVATALAGSRKPILKTAITVYVLHVMNSYISLMGICLPIPGHDDDDNNHAGPRTENSRKRRRPAATATSATVDTGLVQMSGSPLPRSGMVFGPTRRGPLVGTGIPLEEGVYRSDVFDVFSSNSRSNEPPRSSHSLSPFDVLPSYQHLSVWPRYGTSSPIVDGQLTPPGFLGWRFLKMATRRRCCCCCRFAPGR